MKKLLIIFAMLCLPGAGRADNLVITQSLDEIQLPLVYDVMNSAWTDTMGSADCNNMHEFDKLMKRFTNGKMSVPFSGADLYKACRKSVAGTTTAKILVPAIPFAESVGGGDGTVLCGRICGRFVLDYMQKLYKSDVSFGNDDTNSTETTPTQPTAEDYIISEFTKSHPVEK